MSLDERNAVFQINQEDAGDNVYVLSLLDSGWRWRDSNINFSFNGWGNGTSADQHAKQMMSDALQAWGSVANLSFNPTGTDKAGQKAADILLEQSSKSHLIDLAGLAGTPWQAQGFTQEGSVTTTDVGRSHVRFAYDDSFFKHIEPGRIGFQIFLHEIGHSLGLKHPHDSGPSGFDSFFPGLTGQKGDEYLIGDNRLNQGVYTLMSYNNNFNTKSVPVDYAGNDRGPMAFDIAAIQTLYGARLHHNDDSTFYRLYDSSTDKANLGWECIWDTGGNHDTIGYDGTANAVINLQPATLDNSPTGGGAMSYTWRPGDGGGPRVTTAQGFTIAADYTQKITDQDGVTGVIIECATGGSGNDALYGNDTGNRLTGNDGADSLIGAGGNDTLIGGAGADIMVGGAGNDIYFVDDRGDVVTENSGEGDTGGTDEIRTTLSDYTLADDPDSQIENLTYVGSATFLGVGNALDNTITGGNGADFLQGGGGNDVLISLGGGDSLIGGIGNDIYVVGSASDIVVEWADEGIDEVDSHAVKFTLSDNVENLSFVYSSHLPKAFEGHGNALANKISGGGMGDKLYGAEGNDNLLGLDGNDRLFGEAGDDTLRGGWGDDSLDGSIGQDTADYADIRVKTDIDLAAGNAKIFRSGGTETDTLVSIENVIAGYGNDDIKGNASNNTFTYLGYYNRFRKDASTDHYEGGDGSDTIDFSRFHARLAVDLGDGTAVASYSYVTETGGGSGSKLVVTFSSIENVTAGQLDDTIKGDGHDNVFAYVGAYNFGIDIGGVDNFNGGGGSDTADFSRFDGPIEADLNTGTVTSTYHVIGPGGGEGTGTKTIANLTGMENVVGTLGDDTVNGDAGDNTYAYVGSYAVDSDTGGADYFYGGGGSNTVDLSRFKNAIYVDLANGNVSSSYSWHTDTGGGVSTRVLIFFNNVLNVTGSSQADTIRGTADGNVLSGLGGADAITGQGGDDRLTGGGGIDTFVFGAGFGHDVITDFTTFTSRRGGLHDVIQFSSTVFADWEHLEAAITDSDQGAVITYDAGNSVTLTGVTKQQLIDNHESDFAFV